MTLICLTLAVLAMPAASAVAQSKDSARADEAMVEISQGVNVRVVKSMISQVGARTAIAANDAKA